MELTDRLACDRCGDALADIELLIWEHDSSLVWVGYCPACDDFTAHDAEPQPAAVGQSWPPGGWPKLIAWGIAGAIAGLFGGCGPLP